MAATAGTEPWDRQAEGPRVLLDLHGLKCPLPVLRTRKALAALPPGAILAVTATDPMAAIDIPHLVRELGDELASTSRDGEALTFLIRRRSAKVPGP